MRLLPFFFFALTDPLREHRAGGSGSWGQFVVRCISSLLLAAMDWGHLRASHQKEVMQLRRTRRLDTTSGLQ